MDDLAEQPPKPEGAVALKRGEMLCVICSCATKKAKNRWGNCCRKDVEAAEKSAIQGGDSNQAVWAEKKEQDDSLRQAVLAFRKASPAQGRGMKRNNFDWVSYKRVVEETKQQGDGFEGEMMDKVEFVRLRFHRRGEVENTASLIWKQMELHKA